MSSASPKGPRRGGNSPTTGTRPRLLHFGIVFECGPITYGKTGPMRIGTTPTKTGARPNVWNSQFMPANSGLQQTPPSLRSAGAAETWYVSQTAATWWRGIPEMPFDVPMRFETEQMLWTVDQIYTPSECAD